MRRHTRRWTWTGLCALALAACGGGAVVAGASGARYATTPTAAGAVNPRALPLGDGYVSTTPKVGYVDTCISHFGIGGAGAPGPWIDTATHTWDETTKLKVNGSIRWPSGYYTVRVSGGKRVIRFNDLPINHNTGIFPIATTDPAYQYDRNGNHIASHTQTWSLPASPKAASRPSCTNGGPIGVLSDGVELYNALDGGGRDAAAHEVLDLCAGHPDPSNSYHHHDIPPCILNRAPNGRATLVGYALDGYGIYVVKDKHGTLPTNRSLDACHGTTSVVSWQGRRTRIYHYVATLEYPYTVACYHGSPVSLPRPSGPAGGATGPGGTGPGGSGAPGGSGGPPAPTM